MSSSYSRWTPDVFVNFKDDEVELKGFTSALFKQLKEAGIGYRHSNGTNRTEAIRRARFALVVFSANYANSRRCLDELVKILLRRGDSKYLSLVVIPIFHGIDPAQVLEFGAKDAFQQALHSVEEEEKDKKKKEWRRALAKVEGISGYEWKKDADGVESELIKTIIGCLVNEIQSLYSHKVFGPFGGSGKRTWHSRAINGIYVEYEDFINSIEFDVEGNNTDELVGVKDGCPTYKVKLIEEEHITSFSGYLKKANNGEIRIESLKFETNKRTLRHINGKEEEKEYFSVPLPSGAGKVIEFFGSKTEDDCLTSIGARVELTPKNFPQNFRPGELFGSRRGSEWSEWSKTSGHETVKRIRAELDSSGNGRIRSIKIQHEEENGVRSEEREHGSDAERPEEFIIEGADEYLSSISGYCNYDGITSLKFLTNKKNNKIIGCEKGEHFSSPPTGCEIVGFYGWTDEHLHGIGAYFKPIPDLHPVQSIGPFGRGNAWDDGKFKGVMKVHIAVVADDIRYIKIVYDDGSANGYNVTHGDNARESYCHENEVSLEYPMEYLISISGYTREDGSIQSLTFDSTRKSYGPYGKKEGGEYFWYPSNGTKIIGFYGTWGKTLDSIGVYVKPIQQPNPFTYIPFKGHGGTDWDDGTHSNVIGYRVTATDRGKEIESITFMYVNNGSLVEGSRHGGGDAGIWVMLDFPKKRLTGIKGYWRKEDDQTIIHDLRILTWPEEVVLTLAKREDLQGSTPFSIPGKSEDQIVGFCGKAGEKYLNSIEAHQISY